ncbi:MAG: tRNA epoxyqueuosine(34) reductase QueG [Bdellovibrionaceae bacterium]|nr:tRNA epoxyqueuosine(34) reductase QueG [Pseudobdellovibrionaceae bacterium]
MEQSELWRQSDLEWLKSEGFTRFGLARLERPLSLAMYDEWLNEGLHGEMDYLARHRDQKADPKLFEARMRSALVFSIDYVAEDAATKSVPHLTAVRTALYARSQPEAADYHVAIKRRLQPVLNRLELQFPSAQFRLAIDTAPVLERELAQRAGLGWVGKNTCLIDRKAGSLFFIAEILSSLDLADVQMPAPDHCGTCTRCLDACPTQALISPRKLDARRCISYWTIEAKTVPPEELRPGFQDWFFGCDICQTVCPWNIKRWGESTFKMKNDREELVRELRWILTETNSKIEKTFQHTALARARGRGLKRNALIVIGNSRLHELKSEVEAFVADSKLAELAEWTLNQFNKA